MLSRLRVRIQKIRECWIVARHSRNGFLCRSGLEEAAQRENDRAYLDGMAEKRYLDKSGSVSALVEVEGDYDYDARHIELNRRLIHNGS